MSDGDGLIERDSAHHAALVLGVGTRAITSDNAFAAVESRIATRERHCVCVTGALSVSERCRASHLREIHNCAGVVVPEISAGDRQFYHGGGVGRAHKLARMFQSPQSDTYDRKNVDTTFLFSDYARRRRCNHQLINTDIISLGEHT